MKLLVLGEAGCAALKVCYQVYYCLDADSMAASHGNDIIAEGEPEDPDRLDEKSKRLVVEEVLDRDSDQEHRYNGQCLKRHVVHIEDQGLETSCCDLVRKGSRSKGSRSAGRIGGAGGEAVPARHRHGRLRLQWPIRHAFLREKTGCDDVETTEDGVTSVCQGMSYGHAEALSQIRSSGVRRHRANPRRLQLVWH